jgi:hypothetical protein
MSYSERDASQTPVSVERQIPPPNSTPPEYCDVWNWYAWLLPDWYGEHLGPITDDFGADLKWLRATCESFGIRPVLREAVGAAKAAGQTTVECFHLGLLLAIPEAL